MISCAIQRTDKYTLKAFSEEDAESIGEFPIGKILRAKISGALKPRSYEQLKLYHAMCRTVADNTDDPNWNTPQKVDFQVKVACRLIDEFIVVNGVTHLVPGSVSYAKMKHLEACNFFDRAFDEMAKHLGVTRDKLLENATM